MCMEDIRLGRDLRPIASVVTVDAATPTPLCKPDPLRTRLMISGDGSGLMHIAPSAAPLGSLTGWTLTATHPTTILRVEDWGNLVCMAWFGLSPGANQQALVAESTLEKR